MTEEQINIRLEQLRIDWKLEKSLEMREYYAKQGKFLLKLKDDLQKRTEPASF